MKKITILLATLLATLCLFQSSHAATAVPDAISYQGRALTATGALIGATTPVNRTVIFRIWDHPSNSLTANLMYSEQQVVTIAEGEFSVLVGTGTATAGTPLGYSETSKGPTTLKISDAFGGVTRYLGVTIDDGTTAVDNEISPRQQIVSGAFALRSKVAESVDGLAITTAMLANNSVTTTQVNNAAITTSKLAASAVTATQIADATITSAKIAADTILATNIAAGAVGTSEILDGTIATADIANLAVTTAKIATDTILAGNIAADAVGTSEILDGTITDADIAAGTVSLSALVAAVQQALVPPGTIVAYSGATAPAGWLLCHGQAVSRTTYAALYAVQGNAFGTPVGTDFNLPDLRGRFLRGWDKALGKDPDRLTRTAMATGGATGDAIGSVQDSAYKAHGHSYVKTNFTTSNGIFSTGGSNPFVSTATQVTTTSSNDTGAGNETRPTNVYVNYIIKY